MKGQLSPMSRKFRLTTMIVATVISLLLIFAGFSVPYMTVTADDDDDGSTGLFVPFSSTVSSLAIDNDHEDSNRDEDAHGSSLYSRYNVIQAACSDGNIITTDGTDKHDIMLGCDLDDIMYGKSASDVLQGRLGNDKLYGDSGDDNLEGGAGGDELYAGRGDDVIFAGLEDDFLVGGEGSDELYGQDGNDLLEGGDGADYFDCGDGLDVIIDFKPSKGDTHTNNCEDVRERL
jgi:Ca2+-binding RTX toxin-like protein